MDKHIAVYLHKMGFCSTRQRNELSSREKMRKNLMCILLSVRRQSEKAIDYDSKHMTFWKGNMKITKRSFFFCQELGAERDE